MKCDREDCTGDHRNHGWSMLCEATKERQRVRQQRLRVSPGTYRYKEAHGEGLPGLKAYLSERTRDLTSEREALGIKLLKSDQEIECLERQLKEQLNARR